MWDWVDNFLVGFLVASVLSVGLTYWSISKARDDLEWIIPEACHSMIEKGEI